MLQIVAARVGREPAQIPLESSFESLGFESMDAIEILYALEDELVVSIPDERARSINNVHQLIDVFEQELGS